MGGSASSVKGDREERHLVNYLDKHGWAVLRAPASGSATERELPDVLAGNGDNFYAMEAKASSDDRFYIDKDEVEALRFFARSFGADAKLAVKFNVEHGDPAYGEDWTGHYLIDPEKLHETEELYRVDKDVLLEKGTPVKALADGRQIESGDADAQSAMEWSGDGSE